MGASPHVGLICSILPNIQSTAQILGQFGIAIKFRR